MEPLEPLVSLLESDLLVLLLVVLVIEVDEPLSPLGRKSKNVQADKLIALSINNGKNLLNFFMSKTSEELYKNANRTIRLYTRVLQIMFFLIIDQ